MKRLTLELGGKSPNIILDDADFSTAIPMAVAACYLNNGQACIAASRPIVPEDRLGEVKRLVRAAVERIKMGDPRNKDVTLGPLGSITQYKRVQEYIKSGIEESMESQRQIDFINFDVATGGRTDRVRISEPLFPSFRVVSIRDVQPRQP